MNMHIKINNRNVLTSQPLFEHMDHLAIFVSPFAEGTQKCTSAPCHNEKQLQFVITASLTSSASVH